MPSIFEVYRDSGGQFRFRLKAANNEIIAVSEAYGSKAACIKGIESVRKNALTAQIKDQTGFNDGDVKKILKLLGRFNKLEGKEIKDLTSLDPERVNDAIDYLNKIGVIRVKGEDPPFNFSKVSINKEGLLLYNKKVLEGQFET